MNSLNFTLQYRPLRIGWCVRANDFGAVRGSILNNFTMCGGPQNPLIVVDDVDAAEMLVYSAHVDVLLAVNEDEAIAEFKRRFEALPDWPPYHSFYSHGPNPRCNFLDIVSLARSLTTDDAVRGVLPELEFFFWNDDDPLFDVLLASCGRLPHGGESGAFVANALLPHIARGEARLLPPNPIPIETLTHPSLRDLCNIRLEYDIWNAHANILRGVFVGRSDDFWSVVNYWNIRASGSKLLFYDPAHNTRMQQARDTWLQYLMSPEQRQQTGATFAIVGEPQIIEAARSWLPPDFSQYPIEPESLLDVSVPLAYYPASNAVANVSSTQRGRSATMPVPPLAHLPGGEWKNVALVSKPAMEWPADELTTFQTPHIPWLNTFYGEKVAFLWTHARAEPRGLALLQDHYSGTLTLHALNIQELFEELFRRAGVAAKPSSAGLVTKRVISQLGGVDDCRVFRVRGLRRLIEETRPEKSFTRGHAIQTIREALPDGSIGFDRYDDLHIEPPPARRPKPEDIFRYMVSRGAFRVGLEFECTECSLKFWTSLDAATASPQCEYCGKHFDATPQLRDRDWRYRRSGVFGNEDSQLGGIPVALALLRFLHMKTGTMLFTPALTLRGEAGLGVNCEIDFIALFGGDMNNRVQVAIGECKTRKEITAQDTGNLIAVADLLEKIYGLEVFIVFAKLEQFSGDEIALIRAVNPPGKQRAIILTENELERWFPYKWVASLSGPPYFGSSLQEFAMATVSLYLNQSPAAS